MKALISTFAALALAAFIFGDLAGGVSASDFTLTAAFADTIGALTAH